MPDDPAEPATAGTGASVLSPWRRLETAWAKPVGSGATQSDALDRALRARAVDNLRLVALARTAMLSAVAAWLAVRYGLPAMWDNLLVLGVLVALGLVQWRVLRDCPQAFWPPLLFVTVDVVILTAVILVPGGTYPDEWPWQMVLRQPTFIYLLLIVALGALSLQPLVPLWTGFTVAVTWLAGTALIVAHPTTLTTLVPVGVEPGPEVWLEGYLQPTYVHDDDVVVQAFVTLLVAALLSLAAFRARALLFEQVEAARERTNLARYLSPALVEQLAGSDQPLGQVRTERLVVLFADMRGFTQSVEGLDPPAVVGLLRGFHRRLAEAVFAHGGSIDKFIGDAQMAVFGLPEPRAEDAERALDCAEAILRALATWNTERAAAGEPPVRVGIGIHVGDCILGDIGGAERFEFAVIGDTVNVASRLEGLTRKLGTSVLLSADVARAVADPRKLGAYQRLPAQALRGRDAPVDAWARAVVD
ncbi:MAG: adenylate/guanylate cyclase domain-containing protein [Pseudomonadota bacterium]